QSGLYREDRVQIDAVLQAGMRILCRFGKGVFLKPDPAESVPLDHHDQGMQPCLLGAGAEEERGVQTSRETGLEDTLRQPHLLPGLLEARRRVGVMDSPGLDRREDALDLRGHSL